MRISSFSPCTRSGCRSDMHVLVVFHLYRNLNTLLTILASVNRRALEYNLMRSIDKHIFYQIYS
ncbi:hypothetical protein BOSE62_71039 [Bosea sp. 62]|nr:hypothetical protein BOSE7B_60058 [Bosea sp. 7B]CAD5297197.1 hypothetical protein BOSE21B_90605 [Bosea sp. 21B]CAD5297491.1 hypothetical protein BOSE46_80687 [Bosea sp. 46]VVT61253.1 hypothetical protein BOS5A_230530 [Bosea sp. EC-HK365B]VXB21554.1 hypothetical protein BOSE125_130212 [Bosea sp. 125]VXB22835.1 hypothetical protein BOSE127_110058 [Bosea sp. 127]VXC81107.1 hypothetical protein BOSE29B_80572 [Bosea sp. 29B]VXC85634.1 hypothetical protein BOSE62_71039 [Bosea sp. 62]